MTDSIIAQLFTQFWKAYPARNKTKIGRYPCSLWFEAKNPSPSTVRAMIDWLEQSKANRDATGKEGTFHAAPCDPIRFLRERMWEDPIGVILTKTQRYDAKVKKQDKYHRAQKRKELKELWTSLLADWTVDKILNNHSFKVECESTPGFKAWAIKQRPGLGKNIAL